MMCFNINPNALHKISHLIISSIITDHCLCSNSQHHPWKKLDLENRLDLPKNNLPSPFLQHWVDDCSRISKLNTLHGFCFSQHHFLEYLQHHCVQTCLCCSICHFEMEL